MTVEETLAQYLESKPQSQPVPKFLTRQEAAKMLNVSVAILDKMRRDGDILSAYIGTTVRIPLTEITKHFTNLK